MKKHNTLMAALFTLVVILAVACAYLYATRNNGNAPVAVVPITHPAEQVPVVQATSTTSVEFPTDVTFTFPNHPGIIFKVMRISKAVDPNGDYTHFAQGIENPALLTVTLQITNNSNEKLNANYLQVLYSENVAPEEQNLLAPYYIHTAYESDPMSQIVVTPTFIIPSDRSQVSLVTGIYPPINYDTAEAKLSRSVDAYILDFMQQKISHLQG